MNSFFYYYTSKKPEIPNDLIQLTQALMVSSDQFDELALNGKKPEDILLEALKSENFPSTKDFLQRSFSKLPPTQGSFLLDWATQLPITDEQAPFQSLARISSLFSPEQLEKSLLIDAIKAAKGKVHEAQFWLRATRHNVLLENYLYKITKLFLNLVQNTIDRALDRIGIQTFLSYNDSFYGPSVFNYIPVFLAIKNSVKQYFKVTKEQKEQNIVPHPLIKKHLSLVTIAFIVSVGIVTHLYIKYLKRDSSFLPGFQNFTDLAHQGKLDGDSGRESYCASLNRSIIDSNGGVKFHTMLIAPSGAGKTSTMKQFAQFVANGSYPELKNKTVFYINTANFADEKGVKRLKEVLNYSLEGNRENFIFMFDEIHLACRSALLGEYLKTLLDPGEEGIPYVIGATTDKEYYQDIYSKNPAFSRRFRILAMNKPEADEVLTILNKNLLKYSPELFTEDGVLEHLYEQTLKSFPDQPQPYISCLILAQAIKSTTDFSFDERETRIRELEQKQLLDAAKKASKHGGFFSPSPMDDGEAKENEPEQIESLKTTLAKDRADFAKFCHHQNQMVAAKRKLYELTLEVANINPAQREQNKPLIHNYLQAGQIYEAWVRLVQEEGRTYGGQLTKKIIDKTIKQEVDIRQKSETMALQTINE